MNEIPTFYPSSWRVIGALITFPFPQLAPPISGEGEDTLKVVSRENPQSTCRHTEYHAQPTRNKIHIHTLQTFTAATSKRTELLGATEYIIHYILKPKGYAKKKKKK